jgi:hypothetical protein
MASSRGHRSPEPIESNAPILIRQPRGGGGVYQPASQTPPSFTTHTFSPTSTTMSINDHSTTTDYEKTECEPYLYRSHDFNVIHRGLTNVVVLLRYAPLRSQ